MIIEKTVELPNGDAPPAYEASVRPAPSASTSVHPDVKRPLGRPYLLIPAARSPPVATSWFPSSTTRQVRATVLGLVRDLVKLQPSDQSVVAISILQSCVDACAAHGLSISTLLQEKSVEGHTPLYWAIIKRPRPSSAEPTPDESLDLLTALLAFSTPLTPSTTSDVRLACLLMSDQELFRQLRATPEFAPLSATDALLLDATSPPDDVAVEDLPSGADAGVGAFAVDFALMRFQKRMNVSGAVSVEFIARGRMWRLGFHVAAYDRRVPGQPYIGKGAWYASLSLLENSPPTWVDSRLLVAPPPESDTKEELLVGARGIFAGKARSRPALSMRLKAHTQLRARRGAYGDEIVVPLDTEGGMGGLQYAGCPYISTDETLHGRLEASLAMPQSDCIIC
ncbi:hypothetical protein C8F04DRAFT_1028723 [Mycena alexandri]|uniref:Uncharacterized protein n=1 Tax=Mycena alexandri TaxID=1745969 RepID=A0AAD6TDK9_9AGAR|nr:hypothetical protein C8F04DRAFT_1028723 [Mycena alexandri]